DRDGLQQQDHRYTPTGPSRHNRALHHACDALSTGWIAVLAGIARTDRLSQNAFIGALAATSLASIRSVARPPTATNRLPFKAVSYRCAATARCWHCYTAFYQIL